MKALDVCDAAGITYRQLDYWIRCEYLHVRGCSGNHRSGQHCGTEGSGSFRDFTAQEVEIACRMGGLVRAFIAPAFAAQIARQMVTERKRTAVVTLDDVPRIKITWMLDPKTA